MSPVGVVVIGRNEGERLRRCFLSLEGQASPIVYVDSGSTDESVAMAQSRGIDVIKLDPTRPFSAGRARNEGLARCKELNPDLRFVMFVDGDCEVVSGWLARAERELDSRPDLAVVCGRRRELFPDRSVYNRLADLEWDTPVGLTRSCGGDAMVRLSDFEAVGGFDPTVKAGEEPELCRRLRQGGRQVARIDAEMTRHDLNMIRLSEWWRRQSRVGYHGLNLESRFKPAQRSAGTSYEESLFGASLLRARIWGLGWPTLVVITTSIAWAWGGLILAVLTFLGGIGLLFAQAGRIAWRVRRRVDHPSDAVAFGALSVLEKWANLAGQFQYLRDRSRGQDAKLIEYKGSASAAPAHRAG